MAQGIYDASKVTVTAMDKIVTGFKKGTFVTANKDTDLVTPESNAQGDVVWALNNDTLGTIVVTLNMTSPWCKQFNAWSQAHTFFPIWVDDPMDGERRGGSEGIVTKVADATFSDQADARAYTIKVGDFQVINN